MKIYRTGLLALASVAFFGIQTPTASASTKGEPKQMEIVKAVQKPSTRSPLEESCEAGHDTRTSDLCAQWKAADAASYAALWAMISTIVAIFGTIGVLLTLRETRRTANAAINATKVAEETSKITIAAYKDQIAKDRPLLALEEDSISFKFHPFDHPLDDNPELEDLILPSGKVRNFGNQPCWIESVWLGLSAQSKDIDEVIWPPEIPDLFKVLHAGLLHPGQAAEFDGGFWRLPVDVFSLVRASPHVIVYGMCQYRSLAQHIFTTRFAYQLSHEGALRIGTPLRLQSHWRDGRVKTAKLWSEDTIDWLD